MPKRDRYPTRPFFAGPVNLPCAVIEQRSLEPRHWCACDVPSMTRGYRRPSLKESAYGQKIETAEGRAVWRRVLRVCRGACGRTTASPANLPDAIAQCNVPDAPWQCLNF